jgi:biopolymer transport protein ExbD
MGMDTGGSGGGPSSEINVTPLVDVCLVLLIIFMVMTPKTIPEVSVRVPPDSKQKKPPSENSRSFIVGLNKDGGLLVNRNPIAGGRDQLAKEMETFLAAEQKKVIFVDFDDDASYGTAVEVLGLARKSGAEVLGIVSKKDKKVPDKLSDL